MDALIPTVDPGPAPASSTAVIASATDAIGSRATAWAVETANRICAEINVETEDTPRPLHMGDLERQGCEACLLTVLTAIARHVPANQLEVPAEAINQVRVTVRQGTSLDLVLRTVWAAHTRVQDALLSVLDQEVVPNALGSEVRALNAKLFAYVDVIVRELTENYEDERSLWHGRLSAARRRIIDEIVAGQDPSDDAQQVLGLQLNHHHLVAVCRSNSSGYDPARDVAVSRAAQVIGRALGAVSILTLERPEGVTEMIWSSPGALEGCYADRIAQSGVPAWATLSVGMSAQGASGLRESHRTAHQASAVARLRPTHEGRVWAYEDVKLLALLVGDSERAEEYTRRTLAGLTGHRAKTADLRETLRHYLLAGRSRQAAAQELHLAPTTVAYRVRRAEELLGRSSTEAVIETLVALELAHAFPSFVD
ncbi:PucR family transcriptional regulator [Rhodococcus aetherivorans]|uniref:PucR family transcriptional regulator n=1 Tax=Rhodococcus aetherivorans TaxID=191292 RepID=UPI000AC074EC|nr:helix-turn-helix domain-containing protein [Rhodococcus aetherivorans]